MYTKPALRSQDIRCTFTELSYPVAADRPLSIALLRKTMHFPRHRRSPSSGLRPDSFDSTSTSTSYRSFLSTTSSHRRRKLLSKMKQLFRNTGQDTPTTVLMMRSVPRKPSTLDFRCIGATESRSDLGMFSTPVYEGIAKSYGGNSHVVEGPFGTPPRIEVALPGEVEGEKWGRGWFEGIC